jgi:hypothetical protein
MINIKKVVIWVLTISIILEAQEIVCKKKKLWGIKTNFKKYEKVLPQVDRLIKKLNSWNEKKRLKAKMGLSKIAGNILPYLIKKFKNKEWKSIIQYDELKRFYDIMNQKVAEVGIGCIDGEGNILWYAMLKKEPEKGTILVGVNNKIINVHSIIDDKFRNIKQWGIGDNIFCKKNKDNQWYYLIWIGPLGRSYILSPQKIYRRNVKGFYKVEDKRYAFILEQDNNKEVVVIDGKKSKEYDSIDSFTFSSDGSKYGFRALKGNKWVVVIDSNESKEYDYLVGLTLSSNGSKYGFLARKGDEVKGKYVAVINGNENNEYEGVWNLAFSPDGSKYGFMAKKGNKWVVVIYSNERKMESKEYDEVWGPKFSSDGLKYGYVARKGKRYVVVINGKESKKYHEVMNLTFSSDGSKYGFWATRWGSRLVVINGKEYKVNIRRNYYPLLFVDKDFEITFSHSDKNGEYGVVNFHKTARFEKISDPFLVKAQNPNQKPKVVFLASKHKKIYRITCTKKE